MSILSHITFPCFCAEYNALTDVSHTHSTGVGSGSGTGGEGEGTESPTLAHLGDAERYYELWKDKPMEEISINTNKNNNNNNNKVIPEAFPFDEEAFVTPLANSPPSQSLLPPGDRQTVIHPPL